MSLNTKRRLTTADITLTSVFSALWVVLNLTLGPLSFRLLGLPVLHDFAAFFTLLLVVWATGKFGTASLVAVIGTAIALLLGGPPQIAGFMVTAIILDILMSGNHHRIEAKTRSLAVTILATTVSAYVTGVIIGVFFLGRPADWSLTFWGGWHLVGGVFTLAVSLPVIAVLKKANVRGIRGA